MTFYLKHVAHNIYFNSLADVTSRGFFEENFLWILAFPGVISFYDGAFHDQSPCSIVCPYGLHAQEFIRDHGN